MPAAARRDAALAAEDVDLSAPLGALLLPNPVLTASGCAAAGQELSRFVDLAELGALVTTSVQLRARSGRAMPRAAETPSGMLNSIGLQGPGVDAFIEHELAWLADHGARVVVSIAGATTDDYVALVRKFYGHPAVSALEVNISCPNIESGGRVFASDPVASSRVIAGVRRAAHPSTPVFAKLTADASDVVAVARACVDSGADGLSMINTVLGMTVDVQSMRPALGGITGGLSGPAIRPIAVRCVWQVREALPAVPIIGMGGIATGLDALQLILAGASAVAVGTAIFTDPTAPVRIRDELRSALAQRGFAALVDAVGYAQRASDSASGETLGIFL